MSRKRRDRSRGAKIGPGLYDKGGVLHVYVEEVLEAMGFPDTLENRIATLRACDDLARGWNMPSPVACAFDKQDGFHIVPREVWLTPRPEVN